MNSKTVMLVLLVGIALVPCALFSAHTPSQFIRSNTQTTTGYVDRLRTGISCIIHRKKCKPEETKAVLQTGGALAAILTAATIGYSQRERIDIGKGRLFEIVSKERAQSRKKLAFRLKTEEFTQKALNEELEWFGDSTDPVKVKMLLKKGAQPTNKLYENIKNALNDPMLNAAEKNRIAYIKQLLEAAKDTQKK